MSPVRKQWRYCSLPPSHWYAYFLQNNKAHKGLDKEEQFLLPPISTKNDQLFMYSLIFYYLQSEWLHHQFLVPHQFPLPLHHILPNIPCKEYKSDVKCRITLGCLDQHMCRGLRLWNHPDHEVFLVIPSPHGCNLKSVGSSPHGCNLKSVIFKHIWRINIYITGISCDTTALRWMAQNLIDD